MATNPRVGSPARAERSEHSNGWAPAPTPTATACPGTGTGNSTAHSKRSRCPPAPGARTTTRKIAEGKSPRAATRSLKRHLSDHIWRIMVADEKLHHRQCEKETASAARQIERRLHRGVEHPLRAEWHRRDKIGAEDLVVDENHHEAGSLVDAISAEILGQVYLPSRAWCVQSCSPSGCPTRALTSVATNRADGAIGRMKSVNPIPLLAAGLTISAVLGAISGVITAQRDWLLMQSID